MIDIKIKPFLDSNMDEVLSLIKESGFTTRDLETWAANNMSAVLAFDSEKLIGAIPFERSYISLGGDSFMAALWISTAYVNPNYRSQGIGSKLDHAIEKYFYPEYKVILVFREDAGSAAFRWYKKIGFNTVSKIESMKLKVSSHVTKNRNYQIFQSFNSLDNISNQLIELFDKLNDSYIGYPLRNKSFWKDKFQFHYYRKSYTYSVLTISINKKIRSYALLGKTSMNDGVNRLDLLEFVCPDDKYEQHQAFDSIMHYAHSIGVIELRIQSLEGDYLLKHALSYGFEKRWETNLMGKMLNPNDSLPEGNWRFFHVDYV